MEHKITYDDVLLKPLYSTVASRQEVDLSTRLGHIKLRAPIVSANMDTVTGEKMAAAMDKVGGLGIIHRFMSEKDNLKIVDSLKNQGLTNIAASIGVNDNAVKRAENMIVSGASTICIDIAHGHCAAMEKVLKDLRDFVRRCGYESYVTIIAGNVATYDGARALFKWGADVVKVGVGPGSLCTTRIQAGVGVPQLSAIEACKNAARNFNLDYSLERQCPVSIIADGGIKNGGDCVKALAMGADAVMIGSLFAGCEETPGEIIHEGPHDIKMKVYRGMASVDAQRDWKSGLDDEDYYEEGEVMMVPANGPIKPIVKKLCNGIRSGCAYMNARSLKELRDNSVHRFVRVTPLGYGENNAHLFKRDL